jgi:hypothetical protein
LNQNAIGAMSAMLGSSFAFGGHLSTLSSSPPANGEFVFGFSGDFGRTPQLLVTTAPVPEPALALLCLMVLALRPGTWRSEHNRIQHLDPPSPPPELDPL